MIAELREPGSEVNAGRDDGMTLQDAYDNGLPEDVHLTISGFLVPKPEHEVIGLLLKGHMPLYPIGFERIEAE